MLALAILAVIVVASISVLVFAALVASSRRPPS